MISTEPRIEVCRSEDVPEAGRLVLDVGDVTIGLFRIRGELRAYENTCPHQGGPVCQGMMTGAVAEALGEHRAITSRSFDDADVRIVCPWHGYEYSIDTGRHPGAPHFALRSFPVAEEDGSVYVTL